ncbi:HAD domain-containing protein [Cupriavidus sp. CuC1]|uniref:HAD domain-containing protein n=1 Tax=Cupriavidus sp. CuC1 TaxID=3373131 RepID=UPI0037D4EF3E
MILFLDYDGVLHPDSVYLVRGRPVLQEEGHLFMWAPVLEELLTPYPKLNIVLSTSWVRMLGFGRARDYLPAGLRHRVIGGTWHSAMGRQSEGAHRVECNWFVEASRFGQISRYRSRAGSRAARWLAIDDDADGWEEELRSHLVETDGDIGLSSQSAQQELAQKLSWLASLEQ